MQDTLEEALNGVHFTAHEQVREKSLDELFAEARRYGTIDIYGMKDGTYTACITFNTIKHTELKARSGFDHSTPNLALQFAIDAARNIVNGIKDL